MPRIPRLTPAQLTESQRELYAGITTGPRAQGPQHFALTDRDGTLNGPFNALLFSPGVGEAVQQLGAAIRYRTALDDRCREIAILLVAARWASDFERDAHEAVARGLGIEDVQLHALRAEDISGLRGAEGAVAETTLALLDGDLSDAQWARARSALGEAMVFELTTLVGYYAMLALQLRVFRA